MASLPHFDPRGEPSTLSTRWRQWKRGFNLYLVSKNVTQDARKVALLLHTAGLEFQDLYYTLVSEEDNKSYSECLEILDGYFIPKSHVTFERHKFRSMQQDTHETMDQFVSRLRMQGKMCEFEDCDEMIRDQIIEKCRDPELRRKFLEKTGTVTLTDLLSISRVQESVESQLKAMDINKSQDSSQNVNMVRKRNFRKKKPSVKQDSHSRIKRCYRCNEIGHFAKDPTCKAKNNKCTKCGYIGHFPLCCKTKAKRFSQTKKAYQVTDCNDQGACADVSHSDTEHAFTVNSVKSSAAFIDLCVGGIPLSSVMIDSGASCNIIDSKAWSYLKRNKVKAVSRLTDKKLFAYGQSEPIPTLGLFEAKIQCSKTNSECIAEVTVIKGEGQSLLCKDTAEKLNLLRVGPPNDIAYSLTTEGNDVDIKRSYPEVFDGVGCLKNYKVHLHIDKNVTPIAQPVRRLPYGLREKVDTKLDELLNKGIIEQVPDIPTTWVSPLVVIPKANGDVRICVDMRKANEALSRERFPIPTIEDVLLDLNGSTVYSKLDIKEAFHQLKLDEPSREITTFICHRGLFRYTSLFYGVSSAPEKYQKVMSDILRGLNGVANICDDLVVHGKDLAEHDKNLFALLDRLKEKGLTLNANKCQFRISKLSFFGHNLGKDGIATSEEKISALVNMLPPQNVSEVKSFLGLAQYSAKFIPNFAHEAEPLRKLTRKDEKFIWGKEQEHAFEKLKELITKSETLAYFDQNSPTRIVCDAGPTSLGAVLTQLHSNSWRVISYASRSLTPVERKYSQTEKESLAIVWAVERFNLYVFGRQFEIETDCRALEFLHSPRSKPSARIERWILRLQGYDYNVVYRPGKSNIADCLSRLTPRANNVNTSFDIARIIAVESMPKALSPRTVERESEADPELTLIRDCIISGNWKNCKLPAYLAVKDELCVLGKLVLRGDRIVIPKSLQETVLNIAHEGHPGIVRMKSRLRTKVWFPKLDIGAERIVRKCRSCQVLGPLAPPEPMQRAVPPSGAWQDLAVDLLGPMPTGEQLLVLVDYYSRYFEVVIMHKVTSSTIIKALNPIFARFGYPFSLKSDNAKVFVSDEFEQYLCEHGIAHVTSPSLFPQANGEIERQNRQLLKAIKASAIEGRRWQDDLFSFLLMQRTTPHASTGKTPAFLMFGRELKTKLPELRKEKDMSDEEVRDRDYQNKLAGKLYADDKRGAVEKEIEVGQKVLLQNTKKGKLEPNFEIEPYTVLNKQGHEVTIQSKDGVTYQRDSSAVKPFINDEQQDTPLSINSDDENAMTRINRPQRERRKPTRFNDYV